MPWSWLTNALPRVLPSPRRASNQPVSYDTVTPTKDDVLRRHYLSIESPLLRAFVPPRKPTHPRSMLELPAAYKPVRMRLLPSASDPGDEKPDAFLEMFYLDVYAQTRRFADAHFGYGDISSLGGLEWDPVKNRWGYSLSSSRGHSLWVDGGGVGREFVKLAALVARQDNRSGGWEAVLRVKAERTALVCGIVAKALEDGAWDQLLFGADEETESMLVSQELATLQSEGYERTQIRSLSINSRLGNAPLPPNFWPAVDVLTYQILALLLPLLRVLDAAFPESRFKPLVSVHQDLHQLVSEAAYLAVLMQRSASIFRLGWPEPGDMWDNNQAQDAASEGVYLASRSVVESAEDKASATDVFAQPLVAKVKIVLWPRVERWRRVGAGGEELGEEVYEVIKSQCVYYCGRADNDADVSEASPTLREYVSTVEKARRRVTASGLERWLWVCLMLGILLALGVGLLMRRAPTMEDLSLPAEDAWDHQERQQAAPQTWSENPFLVWLDWARGFSRWLVAGVTGMLGRADPQAAS